MPHQHSLHAQHFKFPVPDFEPSNINYDHHGILFGHGHEYFTIMETTKGKILRDWLTADQIGPYILAEWEDLPKISIGEFGVANEDVRVEDWDTKWHHNTTMSQLRKMCTAKADEIKTAMDMHAEKRQRNYSPMQFRDVLKERFTRMLEIFVPAMRMQEQLEKQQAAAVAEEFIDWEQGERQVDQEKKDEDAEADQGGENKDWGINLGEEYGKKAVNKPPRGKGKAIWATEDPEIQYKYAVTEGVF